ncbi:hypothetical protein LINPERPRIM_LOCUS9522 [Linum perenne]
MRLAGISPLNWLPARERNFSAPAAAAAFGGGGGTENWLFEALRKARFTQHRRKPISPENRLVETSSWVNFSQRPRLGRDGPEKLFDEISRSSIFSQRENFISSSSTTINCSPTVAVRFPSVASESYHFTLILPSVSLDSSIWICYSADSIVSIRQLWDRSFYLQKHILSSRFTDSFSFVFLRLLLATAGSVM